MYPQKNSSAFRFGNYCIDNGGDWLLLITVFFLSRVFIAAVFHYGRIVAPSKMRTIEKESLIYLLGKVT